MNRSINVVYLFLFMILFNLFSCNQKKKEGDDDSIISMPQRTIETENLLKNLSSLLRRMVLCSGTRMILYMELPGRVTAEDQMSMMLRVIILR